MVIIGGFDATRDGDSARAVSVGAAAGFTTVIIGGGDPTRAGVTMVIIGGGDAARADA
jgi:hypothetical protein